MCANAGSSLLVRPEEQSARTVVVDGLQSMVSSLDSEEKVLRHFRSFGAAPY